MLQSQKLQLEMSEKRKEINAMLDKIDADEGYDADAHAALNQEYVTLDNRYQTALINEAEELDKTPTDDLDAEGKETRGLEHRVSVSSYLLALLEERPLDGPEAELNTALELGGGHVMPYAALMSAADKVEHYAATSAPDNADVVVNNVLGRVFAASSASYLGVNFVSVPAGASNFPVLTGGVAPAFAAKGGDADQTAASFTAHVLDPKRLTAQYLIRVEDINKFRMMEQALTADLGGAIEEALDAQVINGDGAGANVTGFIHELTDPTNPTAVATFADYASARAQLVDGKYAQSEDDVRIVVGANTYRHASGIYQTGSGVSALSRLNPRVSAHIPAPASNIQKAVASRSMGRAVVAMWPGIALVRDNVTRARQGEIIITATPLYNFQVLDESGYSLREFKLA